MGKKDPHDEPGILNVRGKKEFYLFISCFVIYEKTKKCIEKKIIFIEISQQIWY